MRVLGPVLVVVAIGCAPGPAPPLPRPPCVEAFGEAAAFAWDELLGMDDEVPRVCLVEPQPCPWIDNPNASGIIVGTNPRVCAAGTAAGHEIQLVNDGKPAHEGGLSHELLHVFFGDVMEDQDSAHKRPEWTYVPEMKAALARAGY